MEALTQALRDLHHSLAEYPAEWPDDLLAEVGNLAASVKGMADTERLVRATGACEQDAPTDVATGSRRRNTTDIRGL